MDILVTVTEGSRTTALIKGLEAYNARNVNVTEQQFVQKMVDAQLDALVSAYLVTTVSKLEFLNRFTTPERVTIRTAAKASPAVEDYLELLNAAEEVRLTSETTIQGVNALEAAGLIAAGRAAEILATV